MINYGAAGENRSTLQILFSWHGTALQGCYIQCLVVGLLGVLAQMIRDSDYMDKSYDISERGHVMCLFPLAYLLVFRNGESYKRYWEGDRVFVRRRIERIVVGRSRSLR